MQNAPSDQEEWPSEIGFILERSEEDGNKKK